MSGEGYSIDERAQLFFVAPYWAGIAATGDQPETRLESLEALRAELNAQTKKSEPWQIQSFLKPRTLRLRKIGQLCREFEFEESFIAEIEAMLGDEHFDGVFSRITYFDYGIGCIEVSIGLKNLNANNIETIGDQLIALKLRMVDELVRGIPHAKIDLVEIDKIISAELGATARGVPNRFRPKFGKDLSGTAAELMCGPVSRNIILVDSGGGTIPRFNVTLDQVKRLANSFLNESKANDGLNGSRCIPVSHEGFEGAVAILLTFPQSLRH